MTSTPTATVPSLKLGKTPARPGAVKFALRAFADLTALPAPPTKFGHQALIPTWGMLANDQWGDCVFAGAAHETMLWNAEAGKTVPFDDRAVLRDYAAVTGFDPKDPSTDQGTDMVVAASYRRKTGVVDQAGKRHPIAAYLSVRAGVKTDLRQAVYLFNAVGIGIQFPASAMTQFDAGKAWTIVSGSPIEGGHYIPAIGYDYRYVYVVTWGRVQKMSWGFYAKYCDEAVCYLSEEMLTGGQSLEHFDLAALQAALAQLPPA